MPIRFSPVLILIACCGALFLSGEAVGMQNQGGEEPQIAITVVALTGAAAPGTDGTFSGFVLEPVINSAGSIALAGSEDSTGTNQGGIWLSTLQATSLVVLGGNEAPGPEFVFELPDGSTQQRVFGRFTNASPAINAFDGLAFVAEIPGKGDTVWRSLALGDLSLVLFEEPIFGAGSALGDPKLDDLGNAVFLRTFDGVSTLTRSADPGAIDFIVSVGDPLAGAVVDTFFDDVFNEFSVNSTGSVVFTVGLDGRNNRAVFIEDTGSVTLVAREGETVSVTGNGDAPTDVTLDSILSAKINRRGEIIVFADNFSDAITSGKEGVFVGTSRDDLALVVSTLAITSTVKGDVVFGELFPPALFNSNGDVLFEATTSSTRLEVPRAIWRRTIDSTGNASFDTVVEEGQAASGTNSTFDSFDNMILNASGQVAFRAELADGDRGIWMEDPQGALTLVAREGQVLETNEGTLATVVSVFLTGDCGTEDGTPCGFSDQGDLVFSAVFDTEKFAADDEGILRASFGMAPPPEEEEEGTGFRWNQGAGNNNWHGETGGTSNWEDSEGNPVDPPGDNGDEAVEILADIPAGGVFIDQRPVDIGSLDAMGGLNVRQDLTLRLPSQVESLNLDALGVNLTVFDDFTLTGTSSWSGGSITGPGAVINSSTLTITPFDLGSRSLLKPAPLQASPERQLSVTTFTNGVGVTVRQLSDLQLMNVNLTNQQSATWDLRAGDMISSGSTTFENQGILLKSKDAGTTDSKIGAFYKGKPGSAITVETAKLIFTGGAEFEGMSTIDVQNSGATVEFRGPPGQTYRVTENARVNIDSTGSGAMGNILITEGAALVVDSNATFEVAKTGRLRLDDGRISGRGKVILSGGSSMTWTGGTIGVSGFANDSGQVLFENAIGTPALRINFGTGKVLAGSLVIGNPEDDSAGLTARDVVIQDDDLSIDGGLINLISGTWVVFSGSDITGRAGGRMAVLKKARLIIGASGSLTISANLDNTGLVGVDQGDLLLTGSVAQAEGNTLSGGKWFIGGDETKASLTIEPTTQIFDTIGPDAHVRLLENGRFDQLKLKSNRGSFDFVTQTTFRIESDLVNSGKMKVGSAIGLPDARSELTVTGGFENTGTLDIARRGTMTAASFVATRGSVTRGDGLLQSTTSIIFFIGAELDGEFKMVADRVLINGVLRIGISPADLEAEGNSAQQDRALKAGAMLTHAATAVGQSLGLLEVEGDLSQDSTGTLEFEFAGTEPGTEFDQLIVTGTATLGGTVVIRFIDGFEPGLGAAFEPIEAGNFVYDDLHLASLSGPLVELSDQNGSPLMITTIEGKRFEAAGGSWDDAENWSDGTVPAAADNAFIPGSDGDVTVSGPAGDTTMTTLVVGSGEDGKASTTTLLLGSGIAATTRGTTLRADGRLSGDGTLAGRVFNAGRIMPGSSIGRITVDGGFTQSDEGVLDIELAGTGDGQADQLAVNGSVTLSGTLAVSALDGFRPQVGDQFTIMTFDELGGGFDTIENNTGVDRILFSVSFDDEGGRAVLEVESDGDGDGVADDLDNCPADSNATQDDIDADAVGDACDNCIAFDNADQADENGNGFGDVCEFLNDDIGDDDRTGDDGADAGGADDGGMGDDGGDEFNGAASGNTGSCGAGACGAGMVIIPFLLLGLCVYRVIPLARRW